MFYPGIIFLCLIGLLFLIVLVYSAGVEAGRKHERMRWYTFLRDVVKPENAKTFSKIAEGVLIAQKQGTTHEFLAELDKAVDRQS